MYLRNLLFRIPMYAAEVLEVNFHMLVDISNPLDSLSVYEAFEINRIQIDPAKRSRIDESNHFVNVNYSQAIENLRVEKIRVHFEIVNVFVQRSSLGERMCRW